MTAIESQVYEKFQEYFDKYADQVYRIVYQPMRDPQTAASLRPDGMFIRVGAGAASQIFATVDQARLASASAVGGIGAWIIVYLDDFTDTVHPNAPDLMALAERYIFEQPADLLNDPCLEERDDLRRSFLAFTGMWDLYLEILSQSPNFKTYQPLFNREWKNTLDALNCTMELNLLARGSDPGEFKVLPIKSLQEYSLEKSIEYFWPNMHQTILNVVSLMFSEGWNPDHDAVAHQLGRLADRCIRIGNSLWSGTKEIALQGDFSSGLSGMALELGILKADEIRAAFRGGQWDYDLLKVLADRVEDTPIQSYAFEGRTYDEQGVKQILTRYNYPAEKPDITVRETLIAIGYMLLESINDYLAAHPEIHRFSPNFMEKEQAIYEYQVRATATESK